MSQLLRAFACSKPFGSVVANPDAAFVGGSSSENWQMRTVTVCPPFIIAEYTCTTVLN